MAAFTIALITPDKTVLEGPAEFAVIPGYSGELGILAGHEPVVARVMPGNMRIESGRTKRSFTIGMGFAYITPKRVVVLTPSARPSV
jgi:F-type H+-transporting ATPase subunit epsilon